ncbi:hypothetical protein ALP83_100323 [Pseudomonas syringae pv. actinidiae]|uniref:Uncharacterized protein n=2 Tax=Pseudomonas syringae group TaxID=136849 RepID=A0A7Z6Y2B1_PSESF|nr:hypothetical protein AO287_25955 [Pseudomonas savastanoi]RMP84380.1 hypothetical protein ALQ15_101859 [Pseudomonas syringae pv. actinidiae]RMR55462.1 hypothetical protein ALP83_100323 [Pseudomonas syringae pv. actinidiae]
MRFLMTFQAAGLSNDRPVFASFNDKYLPENCVKGGARRPDHSRRSRFTKNYIECCVMLRAIAPRHVNVWLNLNCYAL